MKRLISLFLSVLLSVVFFCACEVQTGGKDGSNGGGFSGEISDSDTDSSSEELENVLGEQSYTVTLSFEGSQFIPVGTDMYAQWTRITDTGCYGL